MGGHAALEWPLAALGAVSLAVVAAGVWYTLDQLLRRRRYVAVAACALVVVAAFTGPGAWIAGVACALVVGVQAICYLYFTARTLLCARRATPRWDGLLPTLAVVVPARDEAAVLADTLSSLD